MSKQKEIKMVRGATQLCKLEGCMGNPKPENLIPCTTFIGRYCNVCFAVHEYVKETLNSKGLEKVNKILTEKEEKDRKAKEEKELLEKGLETEAEINAAAQYKSTGPKSKKWIKSKPKQLQTNMFDENPDEIKPPKKVEEKILRLGIEKEKQAKKNESKNKKV